MSERYYDRHPLWTEEPHEAELRQKRDVERMRERVRKLAEEEEPDGTVRRPETSNPE